MKKKTSRNLIGLCVSAVIVFAAPVLSVGITMLMLQGAFRGTASGDPSEKARVLAEGISESMNATAFGIVISLLAMVATVVFAVRLVRERKREGAKPE